jgi:hypothetical protein
MIAGIFLSVAATLILLKIVSDYPAVIFVPGAVIAAFIAGAYLYQDRASIVAAVFHPQPLTAAETAHAQCEWEHGRGDYSSPWCSKVP